MADIDTPLMQQIFQRTMESLSAPVEPAIALIVRGELDSTNAGTLSPDELVLIARGVKNVQEVRSRLVVVPQP